MSDKIEDLLQAASLEIVEYDIHNKTSMNVKDRQIPYYVMSYIKRGEACLKINDKIYRTGPGDIIIVPPNIKHDHYKETDDETVFLWWHFNFKIANIIDAIKILHLPLVSKLSNQEKFEEMFYSYFESNHNGNILPNLLRRRAFGLDGMALILEGLITDNSINTNLSVPEAFLNMFSDITNPDTSDISLKYFSEKYHMNSTYISNRFKTYFGVSPILMRREITFQSAKLLLRSSNMSIREIAEKLGFESVFSFTRAFSAKEGISPSAYRNANKVF